MYTLSGGIVSSAGVTEFARWRRAKRAFFRRVHQFTDELRNQGYIVRSNVSMMGKSGASHHIDVLAEDSNGRKIIGLMGHGKGASMEIMSTFMVALDGEAIGCYIAPRKLDEEARELADHCKIAVLTKAN
jgi:hypothetical protein